MSCSVASPCLIASPHRLSRASIIITLTIISPLTFSSSSSSPARIVGFADPPTTTASKPNSFASLGFPSSSSTSTSTSHRRPFSVRSPKTHFSVLPSPTADHPSSRPNCYFVLLPPVAPSV
ncbi:hypothetical protein F5X97DRAFT_318422 [Nemania serpens]|nr:hypothetical protein F5X97DRAFT_318422 [Nemania serpens]